MKRQPKPFVVEIKRSSRKNPTPAATPIWDVAALLSSVESDAHAKPSQAAASAFFRSPEPAHALSAHQAERRILPVIAPEPPVIEPQMVEPEMVESEVVEKAPVRAKAARDETVSSVFSTAKPSYDEPEVQYLEFDTVEPPAAPVKRPAAPHREIENVLAFAAEAASALPIRRNRPERDLPRGERWKRRLPKIMR